MERWRFGRGGLNMSVIGLGRVLAKGDDLALIPVETSGTRYPAPMMVALNI